jgi:hypothetical protein
MCKVLEQIEHDTFQEMWQCGFCSKQAGSDLNGLVYSTQQQVLNPGANLEGVTEVF